MVKFFYRKKNQKRQKSKFQSQKNAGGRQWERNAPSKTETQSKGDIMYREITCVKHAKPGTGGFIDIKHESDDQTPAHYHVTEARYQKIRKAAKSWVKKGQANAWFNRGGFTLWTWSKVGK